MSGIPALLSVVNLLVDGFNDANNLFGQKKSVSSFAAFGNLIPDVLSMCGTVGSLPSEVKSLSAGDINTVVQSVAQRLQIPNSKAQPVVEATLGALSGILTAATQQAQHVEAKMIEAKKQG